MAAATVAGMKPSALFRFVVAFMFVEVPEFVEGAVRRLDGRLLDRLSEARVEALRALLAARRRPMRAYQYSSV